MATMREVALRAGVSLKTVSRVFNEDPHVLPETRQRVEAAMVDLDYTLNVMATAFRRGRAPVFGVAVPSIGQPFFAALTESVEEVAARHDMSVHVSSLGQEPGREQDVLSSLLRRQLGALIVAPIAADQSYLTSWIPKLPIVFVDRPPHGVEADCFVADDFGGARAATLHLAEHGHRRVAFVGHSGLLSTTATRLRGYRAAMQQAGVEVDESLVALVPATSHGVSAGVERLAGEADPPTAIFSSDARTTMLLVPALAGRTWAVTAFGDFPMASMLTPALTVIDHDPIALGRMAAERAIERLNGEASSPALRVTVPVRLLERLSCLEGSAPAQLFPSSVPSGGGEVVWSSSGLAVDRA